MLVITNEDIEYAEEILGIEEGFDEQRRAVIRCDYTTDIVACPGSGKTTVLLAKLIILMSKLPFECNRGICVLTHTNVAINEVTKRLGGKVTETLAYPHFIGTIQSFIDRYLAIPAYILYYGIRPAVIDDELYHKEFKRIYSMKYRGWQQGLHAFCTRNRVNIEELKFSVIDEKIYKDGRIYEFKTLTDKQYEQQFIYIFKQLKSKGILTYQIAKEIAHRYVRDNREVLKGVFSRRFKFLFIDEMQDTSDTQIQIVEELFDKQETICQFIGDPNQAIYGEGGNSSGCMWQPANPLVINNSKRFSNNIARIADKIATQPYGMDGENESNIPAYIITYRESLEHVLPSFVTLIRKHELNTEEAVFKAVGWVKEKENGLSIKSYFKEFDTKIQSRKLRKSFIYLEQYLRKNSVDAGTGEYYNNFIDATLRALRITGCRGQEGEFLDKKCLLEIIKEKEALNRRTHTFFLECITEIENGENVLNRFQTFIEYMIKDVFQQEINEEVEQYMYGTSEIDEPNATHTERGYQSYENIYKDGDVEVIVDSVHGVKGETHTATLYLETKYYINTSEEIIEYLKGGADTRVGARKEKHLKVAYVALTRPQKLVCITMHEDVFERNRSGLEQQGWVKYEGKY